MRPIDADALLAECQLAQKQADRHGREFANAFYSGGGDVSTEWWCVEDMIENAPTIEPEREKGAWINEGRIIRCNICKIGYATVKGMKSALTYNFCPNCGADMR